MGLSSKQVSGDHDVDWNQTLVDSTTMDFPNSPSKKRNQQQQHSEPLDCPRCGSRNTKFCYYNNYNKSQPRHFCKACKRHWTKGGTLRNVPVGGGRKNKRLKTPDSAKRTMSAAASTAVSIPSSTTNWNPNRQVFHNHHLVAKQGLKAQTDHQKNISELLYEAFMDSSHQDGNRNFSFSGLGSFHFDGNPSSISGIQKSHDAYDCSGQLESLGSSTITSVSQNTSNSIFSQPWHGPNASSGIGDMANCWNWSDLDTLISADLNIPWDDAEINP